MKNNANQGRDDKNDNYMNIFDHLVFTNNNHDEQRHHHHNLQTPSVYHESNTYLNTNPTPFPSNQFNPPSANDIYQMQNYFASQMNPELASSNPVLLNHDLGIYTNNNNSNSTNPIQYDTVYSAQSSTTQSTPGSPLHASNRSVSPIITRSSSTSPLLTRDNNNPTSPVLRMKSSDIIKQQRQQQKYQQFKFKKNKTNALDTTDNKKSSNSSTMIGVQEPSLDTLIMIKNQLEQEIMRKNQQRDNTTERLQKVVKAEKSTIKSKGKAKRQQQASDNEDNNDADYHDDDDDDNNDDDDDDDAPFIGDGAFSQSSKSSHGSTHKPLSKEDKRKRNTAASARFRIKKKLREQALQSTAVEMTEKATQMEQRVHDLEREIKWLKALLVEKSEERLKQLIKDRPIHSIAFPVNNNATIMSRKK